MGLFFGLLISDDRASVTGHENGRKINNKSRNSLPTPESELAEAWRDGNYVSMPLLLIARIQLNHSAALARGAVKVEHVSYLYNKRRTKNTKRLEKSVASTREDVRRNLSRCRSIGADKLGQKTLKINKESFETCLVSPIIFTYRSISRCIYQPTQSDGTEERVFHSPA